jgi:hypothetical protein
VNLKEYIEANKINKNTFLAIHNKDDRWIIAGLPDDPRLQDYMTLNVTDVRAQSDSILVIQTDYERDMQLAYFSARKERRAAADESDSSDSKHTKTTSTRKKKK